jgi:hypothetical protein
MRPLTLLPLIVLLTGCGNLTRSDYQRPLLSVPENWQRTEGQHRALAGESAALVGPFRRRTSVAGGGAGAGKQ